MKRIKFMIGSIMLGALILILGRASFSEEPKGNNELGVVNQEKIEDKGVVMGNVGVPVLEGTSRPSEVSTSQRPSIPEALKAPEKPLTPEEFMTKLKGIRDEINKTVAEYNQQKEDFEKNLQNQLNKLDNPGEDRGDLEGDRNAKLRLMDDSQKKLNQMAADFKTRIDALKKKEDFLRATRYGTGAASPTGVWNYKSNLVREHYSMKDFEARKRKQDEELKKDNEALKRLEEATQAAETKKKIDALTHPAPVAPAKTPEPKVTYPKKMGGY